MAWWVVPAMLASTAVTVMGISQQKKAMKANAAWAEYERTLNFHYEKQKRLKDETARLSENRARAGASGSQMFTGSSLLIAEADAQEFENDMWFLEKGVFVKNAAANAELQGQLTAANYKIGQTILSGAAQAGDYDARFNDAKFFGSA